MSNDTEDSSRRPRFLSRLIKLLSKKPRGPLHPPPEEAPLGLSIAKFRESNDLTVEEFLTLTKLERFSDTGEDEKFIYSQLLIRGPEETNLCADCIKSLYNAPFLDLRNSDQAQISASAIRVELKENCECKIELDPIEKFVVFSSLLKNIKNSNKTLRCEQIFSREESIRSQEEILDASTGYDSYSLY